MATDFKVFSYQGTNYESVSDYNAARDGFQSGNVAKSKDVNSGIRHVSLVTTSIINLLAPTAQVTDSTSTISSLIEAGLNTKIGIQINNINFVKASDGNNGDKITLSHSSGLSKVITSINAKSAITSTNLASGAQNQIAYQTAPGTTGFISAPTAGQFLRANASGVPEWSNIPAGTLCEHNITFILKKNSAIVFVGLISFIDRDITDWSTSEASTLYRFITRLNTLGYGSTGYRYIEINCKDYFGAQGQVIGTNRKLSFMSGATGTVQNILTVDDFYDITYNTSVIDADEFVLSDYVREI